MKKEQIRQLFKKPYTMIISETLQEEFDDFISYVPAKRLKQNIMRVILCFFKHERATGLPAYTDDLLSDLLLLYNLLSAIDREAGQPPLL